LGNPSGGGCVSVLAVLITLDTNHGGGRGIIGRHHRWGGIGSILIAPILSWSSPTGRAYCRLRRSGDRGARQLVVAALICGRVCVSRLECNSPRYRGGQCGCGRRLGSNLRAVARAHRGRRGPTVHGRFRRQGRRRLGGRVAVVHRRVLRCGWIGRGVSFHGEHWGEFHLGVVNRTSGRSFLGRPDGRRAVYVRGVLRRRIGRLGAR
jgi:hypothetical protein